MILRRLAKPQASFIKIVNFVKICYLESSWSTVLARSALRFRASLVLTTIQGGNLQTFIIHTDNISNITSLVWL
jgi:hypothetical protein